RNTLIVLDRTDVRSTLASYGATTRPMATEFVPCEYARFSDTEPREAAAGITGERLLLTGRVLTPEGKTIAAALLQFWMSDDQGNYDGRGYRLQGYTVTDDSGRYLMEMIVPAC